MNIRLRYRENILTIQENKEAYISPYTDFIIDNFNHFLFPENDVCDFGTGTGILSVVASIHNVQKISMIEKNESSIELAKRNLTTNGISLNKIKIYKNAKDCKETFGTILCNPASLPNCVDVNQFCDGGELGLDMIFELIEFARTHLKKGGFLYLVVTGILPYSLIEEKIHDNCMDFDIIFKRKIPFRTHYKGISEWVDKMSNKFKEMMYFNIQGKMYEELMLWEISWR